MTAEKIEFMKRTDNRHLQTHIRFEIKEALRERDRDLARRRESLRNMLSMEELQQQEELANLFRARVLANAQKRLDWISTAKFEKAEAEKEFLKLKQIQRELMNCEEMRPKESQKITQETKKAQLYQIAEKKAIQMKEKEVDKIWHEALMCLEREKEKQQQYEDHLRKLIADRTVEVLNRQVEEVKQIKEIENEEKRQENLRIEQANHEESLRIGFEGRQKLTKKLNQLSEQKNHLRALENEKTRQAQEIRRSEAEINTLEKIQQENDEIQEKANKHLEQQSLASYYQYAKEMKSEMNSRDKMLDLALVAQGRQMQQKPISKRPYQKSVR